IGYFLYFLYYLFAQIFPMSCSLTLVIYVMITLFLIAQKLKSDLRFATSSNFREDDVESIRTRFKELIKLFLKCKRLFSFMLLVQYASATAIFCLTVYLSMVSTRLLDCLAVYSCHAVGEGV